MNFHRMLIYTLSSSSFSEKWIRQKKYLSEGSRESPLNSRSEVMAMRAAIRACVSSNSSGFLSRHLHVRGKKP